jgi:hypothetical protein
MAAIRSKNTKPELALRAMLREVGATGYRIHARQIPGKPDVAFTLWRVAVFVDGAFFGMETLIISIRPAQLPTGGRASTPPTPLAGWWPAYLRVWPSLNWS